MNDFMIYAFLACSAFMLMAAPLGCFILWKRMTYFGDCLSHSSLLGIALGVMTGMNIHLGSMIVCLGLALVLLWVQQKKFFTLDSMLGIFSHGALSLGIVGLSIFSPVPMDLHQFLFGDILTVGVRDIAWIFLMALGGLGLFAYYWQPLLLMTLDEELAGAEGINPFYMNALLTFMMTIVVALSAQIVGILLVTALLIIPAVTARMIANSPIKMVMISFLCGQIAMMMGLWASFAYDTPTSPSLVVACLTIFIAVLIIRSLKNLYQNFHQKRHSL